MTRCDRIPQRGSSPSSSYPHSQSPQYSDSSQQHRSALQARSPSPDLDDFTCTQMDRDIVAMKALIRRRRGSTNSIGNDDGPSKRRKGCSLTQPGRGIRKIIDLYHDLPDLVDKAKKYAAIRMLDPRETEEIDSIDFVGLTEDQIEDERKDRKRCYRAMQLLNQLIPGFQEKATTANFAHFCAPLQTGANDARADDTSRLKGAVVEWLNKLNSRRSPNGAPVSNTVISSKVKEEQGISNDITGWLLCPIDYDWDNLEVRTKLRNADPGYDITSSFFLRCLYLDEKGDPESPEEGFLKGDLLLRAYRHIFTSPSSASKENTATMEITSRRRDVASTLRLNGHVTPRSIAYTATQLVFSLNSAPLWRPEHAGFHYPSFYYFIVDFFEDNLDDESLGNLLQWWNANIFPPMVSNTGGAASRNAMKSSQKRLQEARARRAHV